MPPAALSELAVDTFLLAAVLPLPELLPLLHPAAWEWPLGGCLAAGR
jgi:hypothetical protein